MINHNISMKYPDVENSSSLHYWSNQNFDGLNKTQIASQRKVIMK